MKERLDILIVNKGLAASREKAKAIIMSGIVPWPPLRSSSAHRSDR